MQTKKIENDEIISLIEEQGLTMTRIGEMYGVSKNAISKRYKKIKLQEQQPESFKELTPKKQRFVMNVLDGKSPTQACCESHDVTSRQSAAALASRMMKEPEVSTAIADLMAQEGISKRARIAKLAEHIHGRDSAASVKCLDLSFKLDGSLVERIDIGVSTDLIRELIQSIPNPQPVIDVQLLDDADIVSG